jgi:DNA-binding FrmR family transcriptional regulator
LTRDKIGYIIDIPPMGMEVSMEEKCCDWKIKNHMTPERCDRLKMRLKRIRGQVEGILRMLEEDRVCSDILNQLSATVQALRGVQREVLRNYLETCVKTAVLEGKEDIYDEVVEVFDKYHN